MLDRAHLPMGDGAEFDAIRAMLVAWGPQAIGIGDDAAVLEIPDGERLVASTDATVENVHFRRGWLSAEEIGGRAAAAALSDLAAMAATPRGLLLALGVPDGWREELDAIARGVGRVSAAAGCPIIGGNITRASELLVTVTVLGSAGHPLRRAGARPGDIIFVTGELGGPGAALAAWVSGAQPEPAHRDRFAHPVPRIQEARWLAERGATAAIDISDGLVRDAAHVARASGVSISIDAARVPTTAGTTTDLAVASGEEYELLVAMPPGANVDIDAFRQLFRTSLTSIGRVVSAGSAPVVIAGLSLPSGVAFDHFS